MRLQVAILLLLSVSFAGCSGSKSPSQTARSWINLTEEGKTEDALKLYSNKAMQQRGPELKTTLSSQVAEISRMRKAGKTFSVEKLAEKITGETARVSLIYRAGVNDSVGMTFDLIQENGSWKINGINEPESEPGSTDDVSPKIRTLPPPPPPPPPSKKKVSSL